MAKKSSYVYSKKKQPVFAVVKAILKIFLHKPKIINFNDEIPTDGLIIAPHRGKWGPMYTTLHYPEKMSYIGAYPMLGSYKERYNYLRNVLYIQKLHRNKFASTLVAGFEAIFSKMIYKGMHLIPSYNDVRFLNTIAYVSGTLKNGLPVTIFPEDSEEGYLDEMKGFHPGFITLARTYNRRYKEDVKIYPMYVHHNKRIMVIGKPFRLSDFDGMSDEEICRYAEDRINKLYHEYIEEKK